MSIKQNIIDELLKNNLGQLEQTPPPDAWSGIQQGLSGASPVGAESATKSIATGVKSASVLTKITIAIVSSAVVAGSYITYSYYNKSNEKGNDSNVIVVSQQPAQPADMEPLQNGEPLIIENKAEGKTIVSSSEKHDAPVAKKEKGLTQESNPSTNTSPVAIGAMDAGQSNQAVSAASIENKTIVVPEPPLKNNEVKQGSQTPPAKPKPKHNFDGGEKDNSSVPADFDNNETKPNIPSTFTPNGDGKNDHFIIEIDNEIVYELIIYDKDGKQVFGSMSKDKTWDGTYDNSGVVCEQGQYSYIFKYQCAKGKAGTSRGMILLLRKN